MNQQTKWSEEAWQSAAHIYKAITEMPFIKELAAGTLPQEKFKRYIGQDSLYINVYCKVLSHIASRLSDAEDVESFLGFAQDGVAVEKGLHSLYQNELPKGMSPICLFYTSLLQAQAYESVAVEAASILPCFWIYKEVGDFILANCVMEGNPYADWIKCYSDPAFEISNTRCIAICDKLAAEASEATRAKMTQAFVNCSRLEWLFWDSAYNDTKWNNEIL